MSSKTIFALIVLGACVFSMSFGKPSSVNLPVESNNGTLVRNVRQLDSAISAGQLIAGGVNSALNSPKCTKGGCHNGYCWAYCHAVFGHEREWCYTTRGSSQENKYVTCSSDAECDVCWKCAASCAVGF